MTELKSTLTYDDQVIAKIIGHALETIDGLLAVSGGFLANIKEKLVNADDVTTGVNVEVGKEEVATDLDIIVEYGKDIPEIAERIKTTVTQEVEKMTHLTLVEININVVDIMTRKEYDAASVTVQDRIQSGLSSAKEMTSEGYEHAKEAAQKAGDYLADKSEDAKAYAVEKTEQVKEYASEKLEQASDLVSEDTTHKDLRYTASVDSDVVVAD